jgi:hypothetical protein
MKEKWKSKVIPGKTKGKKEERLNFILQRFSEGYLKVKIRIQ